MTALITSGSKNVTIGGLAAARVTDKTNGVTSADVTGASLSGISTAEGGVISDADSVLSGMGKLQAQMSNEVSSRQADTSELSGQIATKADATALASTNSTVATQGNQIVANQNAIATKANQSALTAVYSAFPAGTNSLANPGFESNQIGSFNGSLSTTNFSDGWTMQGYSGTENYWWDGAAHNSNYGLLERISIGTVIPANSVGAVYTRIWSNIIKASPGDSITYGVDTRVSSMSLPAGVSVYGRVGVYGCDVNGNDIAEISYVDTPGINVGGMAEWQTLTIPNFEMPSGYSFTKMVLMMYTVNTTNADVTVTSSDMQGYAEFDNAFVYVNMATSTQADTSIVNYCYNPTPYVDTTGWVSSGPATFSVGSWSQGPLFVLTGGQANTWSYASYSFVPPYAITDWVAGAEISIQGLSVGSYVLIELKTYDANGTVLTDAATTLSAYQNYRRLSTFVHQSPPPATTHSVAFFVSLYGTSVGNIAWNSVKIEPGTTPTAYTVDGMAGQTVRNVANQQTQITNLIANAGSYSGQGYIDGLKMVWNSATSLSVTSGAAFIPSLSKCLPSTTTLTLSGLVLAASTWYHVYLYSNAGVPAIECVTTAPSAPYNGTARAKTGDTSRRYIGSVLTDSSGNIWFFQQDGNRVSYGWGGTGLPPQRPAGGNPTTATSVSFLGSVPITATHATLRLQNTDSSVGARVANSDMPGATGSTGSGTNFFCAVASNSVNVLDTPMASDKTILYWMTASATLPLNVDVFGYLYER